jgi:hypothetical protein
MKPDILGSGFMTACGAGSELINLFNRTDPDLPRCASHPFMEVAPKTFSLTSDRRRYANHSRKFCRVRDKGRIWQDIDCFEQTIKRRALADPTFAFYQVGITA